jgi:hypothetical protein
MHSSITVWGNKILNLARLDAESMITNNNQSQAVNYRWRKEGDVTPDTRVPCTER